MLTANDKSKIEEYISAIIASLSENAMDDIKANLPKKVIVEQTVERTVNRFAPESKMLLNSVCNMMEENTFKKAIYQQSAVKADYYSMDIRSEFAKKFSFEVPKETNYKESEEILKKLAVSGAVVIVGGVVSIAVKSFIPVSIAVILAGVMALVLRNAQGSGESTASIVNVYLENVKQTLLSWIDSIEQFYDDKLSVFEEKYNG